MQPIPIHLEGDKSKAFKFLHSSFKKSVKNISKSIEFNALISDCLLDLACKHDLLSLLSRTLLQLNLTKDLGVSLDLRG